MPVPSPALPSRRVTLTAHWRDEGHLRVGWTKRRVGGKLAHLSFVAVMERLLRLTGFNGVCLLSFFFGVALGG